MYLTKNCQNEHVFLHNITHADKNLHEYIYIYIHIYLFRERERERDTCIQVNVYVYILMNNKIWTSGEAVHLIQRISPQPEMMVIITIITGGIIIMILLSASL